MNASSSPGFEEFSAPFLKCDCSLPDQPLSCCFEREHIPTCWKKAKISPLYKKGSKLDPNNYRMLLTVRQHFERTGDQVVC
jgi:hypothetical protein